jgi:REP element-mobilizing transposase RayT
MLLGFHAIFSMYGFWLPNDPRGSGSDYIAVWELFRYGPATKTNSSRSVAAVPHDHALRLAAKEELTYPPVQITGRQALFVAQGFRTACEEGEYSVHACAILPDHVHMVIGPHRRGIRVIVGHLKSKATRNLKLENAWHDDNRPIWGEHGWNVALRSRHAVERAIRYVERNPLKEGKKQQTWSFVTPFDLRIAIATAREVERLGVKKRRVGGAALRSHEERLQREAEEKARRERRG